jgi:hypothetical protein
MWCPSVVHNEGLYSYKAIVFIAFNSVSFVNALLFSYLKLVLFSCILLLNQVPSGCSLKFR